MSLTHTFWKQFFCMHRWALFGNLKSEIHGIIAFIYQCEKCQKFKKEWL